MIIILVVITHIALAVPPPACGVDTPPSRSPPVFLEDMWYLCCAPSHLSLWDLQLLVGVPCHEAIGGQCLISATVTATLSQSCSLLGPKDMERSPFSSILPQFFTQVPKRHDLYPVSHWAPSLSTCRLSIHRLRHESAELRQGTKVGEKIFFLSHAPFRTPGLFLPILSPPPRRHKSIFKPTLPFSLISS